MSNILPNDLINSLKGDPTFDYEACVGIHDKEEKTTSIRLNTANVSDINAVDCQVAVSIPWGENAYYLAERPVFTLDPLFHSGCYYSQEASSMFLNFALRELKIVANPLRALDLCAAPGGKSTLLSSSLHKDSLLV